MKIIRHSMRNATILLRSVPLILILSCVAVAQEQSQYDHGTPPQHAAGVSPFGSYAAADIGTVNLANGALNFKLNVGSVGGRGFWLPITLNYTSKVWSASSGTDDDNSLDSGPVNRRVVYAAYAEADFSIDTPSGRSQFLGLVRLI